MKIEDLIGRYHIEGRNQDAGTAYTYKGTLTLRLDGDRRIVADWFIGGSTQQGSGFFKNDILVINFNYIGVDGDLYFGTVVYKCLNKDTLDGFWQEENGNPQYLGAEYATRIRNTEGLN